MKRFAATLFIAFAYAQAETEEDDKKEDDPLADGWEGVSNWFSAKQEPVAWESIAAGNPCKLSGHYGWFRKVGLSSVFIRETVSDCAMTEGQIALTWAEIENPDEAGDKEAFYCRVVFRDGKEAAAQNDILAKTMDGPDITMAAWSTTSPLEWCKGDAFECERQTTDQWTRVLTEPQTNFPYESEGLKQSTSCTVWRQSSTPNNHFEIKNGTPYMVNTGYILYATEADFESGSPAGAQTGAAVEMTFEAAASLLAGAAVAVVATVF